MKNYINKNLELNIDKNIAKNKKSYRQFGRHNRQKEVQMLISQFVFYLFERHVYYSCQK